MRNASSVLTLALITLTTLIHAGELKRAVIVARETGILAQPWTPSEMLTSLEFSDYSDSSPQIISISDDSVLTRIDTLLQHLEPISRDRESFDTIAIVFLQYHTKTVYLAIEHFFLFYMNGQTYRFNPELAGLIYSYLPSIFRFGLYTSVRISYIDSLPQIEELLKSTPSAPLNPAASPVLRYSILCGDWERFLQPGSEEKQKRDRETAPAHQTWDPSEWETVVVDDSSKTRQLDDFIDRMKTPLEPQLGQSVKLMVGVEFTNGAHAILAFDNQQFVWLRGNQYAIETDLLDLILSDVSEQHRKLVMSGLKP
jgi:hypothetical protein